MENKKFNNNIVICRGCGKIFIPTNTRKKFCSPKCKVKHETNKLRYSYTCSNCGKHFFRNSNKHTENVFCCNKCVGEYNSKKRQENRRCEFCGKIFKTTKGNPKRFCSVKCQNDWQRAFPRTGEKHPSYDKSFSKKDRTLVCQCCGKEYEVAPHLIKTSKFCSRECKHQGMINAARTQKSWKERTQSAPQMTVNNILKKINVKYENEYDCGLYFTVDNFLTDSGLMIEVMGTYWHADIRKYCNGDFLNDIQRRDITQDKRKKTYIKNKYGVNILYLWEEDLKKCPELCEKLIILYIKNKGVLSNYNSFNYVIEKNEVCLSNKNIVGYMDRTDRIKKYNRALND